MSQASLILLSELARIEELQSAIQRLPDGERLLILPEHLQPLTGDEPALNISQVNAALRLQLIDSAICALRPKTIIADLPSLEAVTPNLDRYPQLRSAVILSQGTEKKKRLMAQATLFEGHEILEI